MIPVAFIREAVADTALLTGYHTYAAELRSMSDACLVKHLQAQLHTCVTCNEVVGDDQFHLELGQCANCVGRKAVDYVLGTSQDTL